MIRKRVRRVDVIDSQLDLELEQYRREEAEEEQDEDEERGYLGAEREKRHEGQKSRIGVGLDERSEKQSELVRVIRTEILTALTKLQSRMDKLEKKVSKENLQSTQSKRHLQELKHSTRKSFQSQKSNPPPIHPKPCHPKQIQAPKSRTVITSRTLFNHHKTTENHTSSKKALLLKSPRDSLSSVKLLQSMLQDQISSLEENKQRERTSKEEVRSHKKSIEERINRIQVVIDNERNMQGMYKNLEWQAKEMAESLTETRGLCSYQKQQIEMYRSKLKQKKQKALSKHH